MDKSSTINSVDLTFHVVSDEIDDLTVLYNSFRPVGLTEDVASSFEVIIFIPTYLRASTITN